MKYTVIAIVAGIALLTAGCRSTSSSLPQGARVVGGGLKIEYSSSVPGTAILIDKTSGRTVATKTLDHAEFTFDVNSEGDEYVVRKVLGSQDHTNAQFILYFVPSPQKD